MIDYQNVKVKVFRDERQQDGTTIERFVGHVQQDLGTWSPRIHIEDADWYKVLAKVDSIEEGVVALLTVDDLLHDIERVKQLAKSVRGNE